MRKFRAIIAFTLALIVFVTVNWTAAWLLMPFRTEYGSTWEQYRSETKNTIDVLFFGSSLSYCDVIPAVIYEEAGLRSYVMAGPEQTVPITYYYVKEACKTQKPQLVAVEITNTFYKRYQNYTKANISYMPFGLNRLGATFAGAEKEEVFGLLFPLYNYHYRWTTTESYEIKNHISPPDDMTAGYTLLTKSCAAPTETTLDYISETDNYRRNIEYLTKLKKFCDKEGIELLLYITPSYGKIPEAALSKLSDDLKSIDVTLHNFNEDIDSLELNDDLDWYDPLHFNIRGAEKFSRFLAEKLTSVYTLEASNVNSEIWQQRIEYINTQLDSLQK